MSLLTIAFPLHGRLYLHSTNKPRFCYHRVNLRAYRQSQYASWFKPYYFCIGSLTRDRLLKCHDLKVIVSRAKKILPMFIIRFDDTVFLSDAH